MDDNIKSYYDIGKFATFKLSFIDGTNKVDEYIHCFILEHLEVDRDSNPKVIKVKQIYDLKDYSINRNDNNTLERVLNVAELQIVFNIKRI